MTHHAVIRRISTHLFVTDEDITRGKKIKNISVLEKCEDLIKKCRRKCMDLGYELNGMNADELAEAIKEHLKGGDRFRLDFLQYMTDKAAEMKKSTGDTYRVTVNSIKRFIKRDTLDVAEINADFLRKYESFLEEEPSMRGNNRKEGTGEEKSKKGRALSAYLTCIRAMHNRAKLEYNDEDRGVIRIPSSPFSRFSIKPQPQTRKRALSVETIQKIIDLPYRGGRFDLAKDCFILSFALAGMNSADLYAAEKAKGKVITYQRQKTASRRGDGAEMKIRIEGAISMLTEKYAGKQKMFNFSEIYVSHVGFGKALDKGIKQIGEELGLEDLTFYAARHSWATVARSSAVGADKYTVHEALNHSDGKMKITDIYIDKDWSVIWKVNRKVLKQFDWTSVGYDVL